MAIVLGQLVRARWATQVVFEIAVDSGWAASNGVA
jgi:hypothetical protein